MKEKVIIMLTSEHPNVSADIAFKRSDIFKKSAQTLNQNDFAFEVSNKHNIFKRKHCKSKGCFIYVVLNNSNLDI